MNGMTKLSLAIALALTGGNAFALGLGTIQVKSGLNQPLNAEIPVISDSPAEANAITVGLATTEDFQRVGLNRTRVSVPIDFAVGSNGRGQTVIKLTTKDAVREPFLDFLVEVNWPKGKLLREYTVLLDPPVMAPTTRSSATVTPAREAASAPAQKLAAEPGRAKPQPIKVKPPHTVVAEAKPAPAKPVPVKPAPAPAATHAAAEGLYGPVAQGETLSEVVRATRPDDATNLNEMMLALLKANPNAFYKDNINALKRGAILRLPSHDEIKASGTAMAAAAAVREQNQAWGAGAPVAKPTVVAKTGAPKSSAAAPVEKTTSSAKPSEHLALVPPRAGKGGQATADHPGPASGTGNSADAKAELTRTKEALASREQEANELRSRVKDLEDLNGKDQRLLALKQSEIAELQYKLKELEASKTALAAAATKLATKPAETPVAAAKPTEAAVKPAEAATKTDTKLTAKDIWGDISANEKNAAAKPATPAVPGTAPANAKAPEATSPPAAMPAITAPTTTAPVAATPPASTPAVAPTSTITSPVITPSTSAAESLTAKPAPAAAANPVKPVPAKVAMPESAEPPWYQNNTVLLGGGAGLLLIGLLALMRFMRKPKPMTLPAMPIDEVDEHATAMVSEEEHQLLDELAQHPGDPHLSLELLSLYYAQRDAGKFEAAAEAMYAHIADPTQPEWQQVRAMGEDLCPHNPLFGGHEDIAGYAHDEHAGAAHHEMDPLGTGLHAADTHLHDEHFDLGGFDTHVPAKTAAEESFDFDLTDHAAAPAHADMAHEPAPVSGHPTPPPPVFAPAPAPVAATKPADDFFAGEDTIGTKLDLAKAYLDMGDPEGARSMLDEVMAEGNDTQKGEARKLLAEIR